MGLDKSIQNDRTYTPALNAMSMRKYFEKNGREKCAIHSIVIMQEKICHNKIYRSVDEPN